MHDLELIHNGKLPSINEIVNANRANRFCGAKQKKELTELLAWEFKSQAGGTKFKNHVTVRIECYEGNLRRDDDNVIGGACKIVLDALQMAKIIKNDSPRYCHVVPERFNDADGKYYVKVFIDA